MSSSKRNASQLDLYVASLADKSRTERNYLSTHEHKPRYSHKSGLFSEKEYFAVERDSKNIPGPNVYMPHRIPKLMG